jgi:hypothetical protein
MSHQDEKPGQMVPTPHEAGASAAHGGTSFENSDARAGIVIWSLAIIAGTLVVAFAVTVYIQRFLYDFNPQGEPNSPLGSARVLPPDPQIEVHPWEDFPELRAHEDSMLTSYGKDAAGHLHVPISLAMNAVISHLKIRPGAPSGINTPGGEGRGYGASPGAISAPVRIEIKAPAEEHAK